MYGFLSEWTVQREFKGIYCFQLLEYMNQIFPSWVSKFHFFPICTPTWKRILAQTENLTFSGAWLRLSLSPGYDFQIYLFSVTEYERHFVCCQGSSLILDHLTTCKWSHSVFFCYLCCIGYIQQEPFNFIVFKITNSLKSLKHLRSAFTSTSVLSKFSTGSTATVCYRLLALYPMPVMEFSLLPGWEVIQLQNLCFKSPS